MHYLGTLLDLLQLHLLTLRLQNVCRCLAKQSLQNHNCSHSFGGALGLVVGLVGLCGFGAKSELVAVCSKVLAGSDPAATEPCPVPFGALFALPALELHHGWLFALHLQISVAWLRLPCYSRLASVPICKIDLTNSEHL